MVLAVVCFLCLILPMKSSWSWSFAATSMTTKLKKNNHLPLPLKKWYDSGRGINQNRIVQIRIKPSENLPECKPCVRRPRQWKKNQLSRINGAWKVRLTKRFRRGHVYDKHIMMNQMDVWGVEAARKIFLCLHRRIKMSMKNGAWLPGKLFGRWLQRYTKHGNHLDHRGLPRCIRWLSTASIPPKGQASRPSSCGKYGIKNISNGGTTTTLMNFEQW